MTGDTRARLIQRAATLGLTLEDPLADRLVTYYDLLHRWNETINLTSLEDSDHALDKLILEPVLAGRHLPRGGPLLDVGSGGGSPAVPLALALEAPHLWMVESRGRKAAFLREVVRQLELPATVEAARVEELAQREDLARHMDIVSMRAVRPDLPFLGVLGGFLTESGRLALFVGETGIPLPLHLRQMELIRLIPQHHSSLQIAEHRPNFA